jgi:hypothetical protein
MSEGEWGFVCPECEESDQLDVAATVWVRLTEDGTDADESEDGSHEWGDDSEVHCAGCGHQGTVKDFEKVNQ